MIYQCNECKHTYNLSIYERVNPDEIPSKEYQAFLDNDEQVAFQFGTNKCVFQQNKALIDDSVMEYEWEEIAQESTDLMSDAVENNQILLEIKNPFALKIRTDKVIALLCNYSRSQIKRLQRENRIMYETEYLAMNNKIYFID